MKRMFELSPYIIYMMMMGCASTQPGGSTSSSAYSEDLSSLHPVFEDPAAKAPDASILPEKPAYVEPVFAINNQLHTVLDSIDRINLSKKLIDGFSIQVYSGQKREDAMSCKRTLDQALPELEAEMTYIQPTFRIKAGKYYTQLDAQKDFVAVKRFFPNAILIYDKFPTR